MKKLVSILCVFALVGCASGNAGNAGNSGNANSSPDKTSSAPALLGNIAGEITVSCYDSTMYKTFLDDAALSFEQKYPGTKVIVETVSKMPEIKMSEEDGRTIAMVRVQEADPAEMSDYISKVSTELMSGGGADIIAADIIPYLKYSENGQLVDLSAYIEEDSDWDYGDFLKNVLDSVKYNGGQFIMPINYMFDYMAYDASVTDNPGAEADTFQKLINAGRDAFMEINAASSEHVYMFGNSEYAQMGPSVFNSLFSERYNEFIDVVEKKVSLNSGEFEELLEDIKSLAADGYIKRGAAAAMREDNMPNPDEIEKMRAEKSMYKQKSSDTLFTEFNKNPNLRIMVEGSGFGEDDEIIGIAADSDGKVPFTFSQAFGINANTKNPDTAWAFLKFLLGEEMQSSMSMRGFPIRNSSRSQKAESMVQGQIGGAFMAGRTGAGMSQAPGEVHELSTEQKQSLEEYRSALEEFSAEINKYTIRDTTIDNMISAEVKYFFDGNKSAKEVADVLQSKIELYINE